MSPNPNSKDSSTRPLARLKPDLHISGIAGFLFAICLLAGAVSVLWCEGLKVLRGKKAAEQRRAR